MTRTIMILLACTVIAACSDGGAVYQSNPDEVWLKHRIPSK